MAGQSLPQSMERIRESIRESDLRTGIDQLISLLKGVDEALYNEAIAQSARLVGIQRRERQGVYTLPEVEAQEARLRLALLGLVDEASAQLERRSLPFATAPVRFEPPE